MNYLFKHELITEQEKEKERERERASRCWSISTPPSLRVSHGVSHLSFSISPPALATKNQMTESDV